MLPHDLRFHSAFFLSKPIESSAELWSTGEKKKKKTTFELIFLAAGVADN